MPAQSPCGEPSKVTTRGGEVHLDGPDAVDVDFTPEAARRTGEHLQCAAALVSEKTDPANDPN